MKFYFIMLTRASMALTQLQLNMKSAIDKQKLLAVASPFVYIKY